jgi:uncharacterized membrane protein
MTFLICVLFVVVFGFILYFLSCIAEQERQLDVIHTQLNRRIISICEIVDGILKRRGETDERTKIEF